jgi:hypothetical protein
MTPCDKFDLDRKSVPSGLQRYPQVKQHFCGRADSGRADTPIPVKRSSGGEPLAVVVGESVVALVSTFELRDGDDRDGEMTSDGGKVEVFGLPGRLEVPVVVDRVGTGFDSRFDHRRVLASRFVKPRDEILSPTSSR